MCHLYTISICVDSSRTVLEHHRYHLPIYFLISFFLLKKKRGSRWESNPGSLVIATSALPLSEASSFLVYNNIIVINSAPSLTVTVNNADNAVAGQRHTLSCSVRGFNFRAATIMYLWRLGTNVLQGPSTSNMYNIAMVQVSNAGDVYTCEVTVTASYLDVSGSFGDSGSGTLSVTSKDQC